MINKTFASLEKALDIMTLFDFDRTSFTAHEISEHLNIPLSTTYKYVDVLLKRGLLAKKAGSKEIELGFMIFRLGSVFAAGFDLIDAAIPHMKSLMEQSGETILLTAIEGRNAICLERMEPQRLIKLSMERGRRLPLHAGASSRILLAFQNDEIIADYIEHKGLENLTNNTMNEPDSLLAELKLTRERGYALSDSEVDDGAKAVAAPIFENNGNLLAGLTIAGPSERFDKKGPTELIDYVRASAREISNDIGYRQQGTQNRDVSLHCFYD